MIVLEEEEIESPSAHCIYLNWLMDYVYLRQYFRSSITRLMSFILLQTCEIHVLDDQFDLQIFE